MSRKSLLKPYKMLDSVDMSASQESNPTNVEGIDQSSIQVVWSGTSPVGEMKVFARNGKANAFYELDFDETLVVSGNSDSMFILINCAPFTDIKLQYVRTSGTGTMSATINGKSIGA